MPSKAAGQGVSRVAGNDESGEEDIKFQIRTYRNLGLSH